MVKSKKTDGRTLRAENRRKQFFETLLSFYKDGIYDPSIKEIEERSGISRRTIHHLFTNFEGIALGLTGYLTPIQSPLYVFKPSNKSLEDRVTDITHHRSILYEAIAPTNRAASHHLPRIKHTKKEQCKLSRLLRKQVALQFEKELAEAPESLIETLDVLAGWETWERLRTKQKQGIKKATKIVREMMLVQIQAAISKKK